MFARVAMYHGADAGGIEQVLSKTAKQLEARLADPAEGLDVVREFLLLVDRESGRGLGISLFDSEEDLRRGDQQLSRESLSQAGGVRTGVELYTVALHHRRD